MASQGMKAPSMLALALHSTVAPLALTIMNATGQVASAHEPHVLINGSCSRLVVPDSLWLRASLVRLLVAGAWLWFLGGLAVWAGLFVLLVSFWLVVALIMKEALVLIRFEILGPYSTLTSTGKLNNALIVMLLFVGFPSTIV